MARLADSTFRLASADCRSEDIPVLAIVIPDLELGNIERHVLVADLVEGADDAALKIGENPSIVLARD